MSTVFTVRIPKRLAERMRRHREVNWSEVVRRSIEEYLERLEDAAGEEPGPAVAERLLRMGLSPGDLEPLPPGEEERLSRAMGEAEWRRLRSLQSLEEGSTTRAR